MTTTESAIIRIEKFVSAWRDHDEPAYYARDWGALEANDLELVLAAARTRHTDMLIAIDAIITAHPALKHEDSQEADENYGDLLNQLVDAVLAARGDAAPTEVEWGVQASGLLDGYAGDVERQDSEAEAREHLAELLDPDVSEHGVGYPDARLVQRTVSAWREVEGGETT